MNISIDLALTVTLITTAITTNKIIAGVIILLIIVGIAIWYMRRSKTS
ncbi:MAG TPA: hypothetical protein VIO62_00830 [Candidatus Dormibacteraeota bacterium]|jgi:ABC-type uncharacterized transport system permease subunit